MIKELTDRLRTLRANLEREKEASIAIEMSEEWQSLKVQIDALVARQKSLTEVVGDSSQEYDDVKRDLIAEFRKSKITEYDGVVAKVREENKVNTNKLIDVLGGDVGLFLELSGVTQKTLKDFANLPDNKGIKKAILGTIEKVGEKIVDFDFTWKKELHLGNVKSIVEGTAVKRTQKELELSLPF